MPASPVVASSLTIVLSEGDCPPSRLIANRPPAHEDSSMLRLLCVACLVSTLPGIALAESVKLDKSPDGVKITIDGKEFTTYRIDKSQAKPFFFPVLAADGAHIARQLEKPEDHPHHKGIWCSIDEVNGIKFWAEKGKIENESVEIVKAEGNPAKLKIVNNWLESEGKPLLRETVNVSIHANRLIDY